MIKDGNLVIVQQCRDLNLQMNDITLEFEAWNTNKVVGRLAKMCHTDVIASNDLCSFEHSPEYVSDILMDDRSP